MEKVQLAEQLLIDAIVADIDGELFTGGQLTMAEVTGRNKPNGTR